MFSVAMPIYNHAKFVKQAVWSALRCPLVHEVLLLDDGSTDGSAAIASALAAAHPDRVRNVTPREGGNRGAHGRLNELVELAECEWIAVLNSDDLFVDGRFEAILADSEFPHCDLVFGNVLFMNERGTVVGSKRGPVDVRVLSGQPSLAPGSWTGTRLLDLLSQENYLISTSNMVFRKTLHARIGGFAAYRYVHDWDFALRAMSLGRPRHVQRFLTAYRKHSHNTILEDQQRSLRETTEMFERFLTDFPEVHKRPGFDIGQKFSQHAPSSVFCRPRPY